jgi:hypothetical protein
VGMSVAIDLAKPLAEPLLRRSVNSPVMCSGGVHYYFYYHTNTNKVHKANQGYNSTKLSFHQGKIQPLPAKAGRLLLRLKAA